MPAMSSVPRTRFETLRPIKRIHDRRCVGRMPQAERVPKLMECHAKKIVASHAASLNIDPCFGSVKVDVAAKRQLGLKTVSECSVCPVERIRADPDVAEQRVAWPRFESTYRVSRISLHTQIYKPRCRGPHIESSGEDGQLVPGSSTGDQTASQK